MWFKLNTTFTQSLGTLDSLSNSWSITRNLTNFSTSSTTTSVTKNGSYSATFTLNSGCTYSSHSVTMGGAAVTSGVSYSNGTLTVNISKVTGAVVITAVATGASSGGGASGGNTKYTITYQYKCNGSSIKTATTEQVTAGTTKTFSTSSAPAITGYTVSSVSPTSATIDRDITVTYNYTANSGSGSEKNVVFDLDLVNFRLTDYVSQGLFTVPESSTIDAIAYNVNGANLNNNLPYGLTLTTPIDASRAWTLELTMNMATPTDLVGNRKAIMTGGDDLAPMILINGNGSADKFGFQISTGAHTWVGLSRLTYEQDVTYKFVHNGNNTTTVYANGTELGTSNTVWTGKQFGTILGVIKDKSTAYIWKDVEAGKKSYLKSMKFYYN